MMCQAMANEAIIWKHDHGTKPQKTRSGWNPIKPNYSMFLNQQISVESVKKRWDY